MQADEQFILAVDFGSTKVACALFGTVSGREVGRSEAPVTYHSPEPGSCEMDPEEVWQLFLTVVRRALASSGLPIARVSCLGLCVQRNSLLLWERATGRPLSQFITWRDDRASAVASRLNASLSHRAFRAVTRALCWLGSQPKLRMVSLFSFKAAMACVRLYHLLQEPRLAALARGGSLCAGCLESWLLWRLTGGAEFATEASCAGITGLYDPFSRAWSGLMCSFLGVPIAVLPAVRRSDAYFGTALPELFGAALPIRAILGDQQAALLGESGLEEGQAKITLGTMTSLVVNTGAHIHPGVGAIYPVTLWHLLGAARPQFGAEGNNFDTGPTLDWLVTVGLLSSLEDIEALMREAPLVTPFPLAAAETGLRQLCFVPALSGLQVPRDDLSAGCMWLGMRRSTTRAELVRSALLGIVFQTRQLLDCFARVTGRSLRELRCNGGVVRCSWFMQTLADAANVRVEVSATHNASLLGAAHLAGAAEGFWELGGGPIQRKPGRCFAPRDTKEEARRCWDERYECWLRAVPRAEGWHGK